MRKLTTKGAAEVEMAERGYSERRSLDYVVWVAAGGLLLVGGAFAAALYGTFSDPQAAGVAAQVVVPVVAVVVLLGLIWTARSLTKFHVIYQQRVLRFGFQSRCCFDVEIDVDDIEEAAATEINWPAWGGVGVRLRCGHRGYIVGSGPGVTLTTRQGRRYTFNCRNPSALLELMDLPSLEVTKTDLEASPTRML